MAGYRHFLFGPEHSHVIASLRRKWIRENQYLDEDLFLTLKVSCHLCN